MTAAWVRGLIQRKQRDSRLWRYTYFYVYNIVYIRILTLGPVLTNY